MTTISSKPFYFMRHGETDLNRQNRAMGKMDIPLNDHGLAQAHDSIKIIKDIEFESIAVSPLQRALKTAEIIANQIPRPIHIIEDLKECSWGIMDGQPKGDGSWLEEWRQGKVIEEAETFSSFCLRVMNGLIQALDLPGPVLVIAHGGVYWAIREGLSLPFMDLPNCVPVYHRPPEHPSHPWFVCPLSE